VRIYTTYLQPSVPQFAVGNEFLAVAPGEGQIPLDIMLDNNAEALGFPNKFPLGRGGFTDSRLVPITLKKYSNQRV